MDELPLAREQTFFRSLRHEETPVRRQLVALFHSSFPFLSCSGCCYCIASPVLTFSFFLVGDDRNADYFVLRVRFLGLERIFCDLITKFDRLSF